MDIGRINILLFNYKIEGKFKMDNINKLYEMILSCNYIVAFTGAGVSTDSGLKDFRGENGLYKQKSKYTAEYMLSSRCF